MKRSDMEVRMNAIGSLDFMNRVDSEDAMMINDVFQKSVPAACTAVGGYSSSVWGD
jgi:hypothetical protein